MKHYIDSHCHLQDPRCEHDLEKWIQESSALGITGFVLAGVSPEDWTRQQKLIEVFQKIQNKTKFYASAGLHPWWVSEQREENLLRSFQLLKGELKNLRIAALGETGLDFQKKFTDDQKRKQRQSFKVHLELSLEYQLPLILHVVEAHEETLEILRLYSSHYKGIVHSFSGNVECAKQYRELGLMPSLSLAVLSRQKGPAFERVKDFLLKSKLGDFLLETDCPDQPPVLERNTLNTPMNLIQGAEMISQITGRSSHEILAASRDLCLKIFK